MSAPAHFVSRERTACGIDLSWYAPERAWLVLTCDPGVVTCARCARALARDVSCHEDAALRAAAAQGKGAEGLALSWDERLAILLTVTGSRRSRRAGVSPKLRFAVLRRDGFACAYCGARPKEKQLQVDHVVPVAAGGPTTLENLVTACTDCNAGKGSGVLA